MQERGTARGGIQRIPYSEIYSTEYSIRSDKSKIIFKCRYSSNELGTREVKGVGTPMAIGLLPVPLPVLPVPLAVLPRSSSFVLC